MKKFKDLVLYYAYTLFSNKEAIRAYTKSWKVSIFAYLISILILLTPITVSKLFTSNQSILDSFDNIELAFNDVYEYQNAGIPCEIKSGELTCINDESFEIESNGYLIVINKDLDNNIDVDKNKASITDNIIIMNKSDFYARYVVREDDGIVYQPISELEGDYSKISNINFQIIYNNVKNKDESYQSSHYLANTIYLLNGIDLSNFNRDLVLWTIQNVLSTMLLVVSSALMIFLGNRKGQRADEYGFKGSLKISFVSLIGVSFVCSVIGLLSLELTPVLLSVVYIVRILLIYINQFTRRGQKYNIVKYRQ
jgi:hypothetical protein